MQKIGSILDGMAQYNVYNYRILQSANHCPCDKLKKNTRICHERHNMQVVFVPFFFVLLGVGALFFFDPFAMLEGRLT